MALGLKSTSLIYLMEEQTAIYKRKGEGKEGRVEEEAGKGRKKGKQGKKGSDCHQSMQ